MDIRPATPNDSLAISALIRSMVHRFTLHPEGIGAEDFLKTISPQGIEGCITAPNFLYLAGFIEGELAGVMAIRDNDHLYHLFVAPLFQRRGIAKALWNFARSQAIQRGNPGEFTVNSTPFAVPVYESFGFAATGHRVEAMGIAFVPMKLSAPLHPLAVPECAQGTPDLPI
jgi:GNAT superfamily N-acetyltransferase